MTKTREKRMKIDRQDAIMVAQKGLARGMSQMASVCVWLSQFVILIYLIHAISIVDLFYLEDAIKPMIWIGLCVGMALFCRFVSVTIRYRCGDCSIGSISKYVLQQGGWIYYCVSWLVAGGITFVGAFSMYAVCEMVLLPNYPVFIAVAVVIYVLSFVYILEKSGK